jgi:radical SAM protein with 4Fe4S-binding SPASM domain
MLCFCDNVYYVKGRVNACLYDLNFKKLYHISPTEIAFLDRIIGKCENELVLSSDEKEAFHQLQVLHLVHDASELNSGDIRSASAPAIKQAWIEVTQTCNLFCCHCYEDSAPVRHERMTMEDFHHCIDELEKERIPYIQFIGGEPLCLKSILKEMIDYTLNKFSKIEVFTNGTLISDEWARYFAANNIHVALSVYSYIPEMHDAVTRKQGSFLKTTSGIQRLKDHNVKYRVANVLMNGVELGKKNTDLFRLSPNKDVIRMSGRGNIGLLNEKLIRKKLIDLRTFEAPLKPNLVRQSFSFHQCFSTHLYVDANLNVYPCVMERRLCHGSLKNKPLREVLKQDIFTLNKDKVEECMRCEFRYCCFDCRPNSFSDNVFAKPWYCTYSPDQGIWLSPDDLINKILDRRY